MNNKANHIISVTSYIISAILIVYYLFLELSIIDVTSPIKRLIIVLLIVLFMHIGLIFFKKTNNEKYKKLAKINVRIWLILYLIMILNLTLFDKYFGRNYHVKSNILDIFDFEQMKIKFSILANVVPFKTIGNFYRAYKNGAIGFDYFIRNIFGNVVAFMPLSFLLPRAIKRVNKWYKFFIITSIFILLIEFSQFLMNSGAFDIDDYILNISGALILYMLINNKIIGSLLNKVFYLE